jgi:hypothetical protein
MQGLVQEEKGVSLKGELIELRSQYADQERGVVRVPQLFRSTRPPVVHAQPRSTSRIKEPL